MPDSLMLYFFITGINANIEFAQQEMKGNEYQRPLEKLLELFARHNLLLTLASDDNAEKLRQTEVETRLVLDQLAEVDARIGTDLQFTKDGLAMRHREHFRADVLRQEWDELLSDLPKMDRAEGRERSQHLIDHVRMMITHAGDLSNLILDPDLDSYYLMDATLLVLPQNQDRIARIMSHAYELLNSPTISTWERQQQAVNAKFLKEADLDRIVASLQTALNEDANFYGVSPSLQTNLPKSLANYQVKAEKFIKRTQALSGVSAIASTEDYLNSANETLAASFELWNVAADEMDHLLQTRIQTYEWRRMRSLLVAALAACAAFGFVTFITRSISGPLQAQALALRKTNEALEAEITERNRVEAELRRSEGYLAAAQAIARVGSWDWDILKNTMTWSEENYRIHGFASSQETVTYETALERVHPGDRTFSEATLKKALKKKKPFSFEQRIVRKDGATRILHQSGEVVLNDADEVVEVFGTAQDVTERKLSEQELERVNKELITLSREAGMAEVATGVLHNVGNVLNSVNVSAMLISDRISKSRVAHIASVAQLFEQNASKLGEFLTTDPKGKMLPKFISTLSERLTVEQSETLEEAERLAKNIAHIKDIVAVQQNYAKVSGMIESLSANELVEDALGMNGAAFDRHHVEVIREFSEVPNVLVDKHKVLQILVNLIRNAKYAVSETARADKRIHVRIGINGNRRVKIAVADNGIGIAKKNLARIFEHGFTTKEDGHGFGLHSAALAASELGGSLAVQSPGAGKGATFTLEIPIDEENAGLPS